MHTERELSEHESLQRDRGFHLPHATCAPRCLTRAGWDLSCPANAWKSRSDCDVCWQSTLWVRWQSTQGCPACGHCARTKSYCVLSASDVDTIQEARLLTVIPRPLTRTSREWCDTGTFGEAAAGGEQEIPAKLVSRAPELAERAPPTTHDYLDAETGLGDSEGRNPLGRRHSARDVLAKQSDFADDNRDPNKVVPIFTALVSARH